MNLAQAGGGKVGHEVEAVPEIFEKLLLLLSTEPLVFQ